jgi:prevent-host-death family protein
MCYMGLLNPVGVRELRQNASVYLRRVQAGETLEITDRGVPIAILAPVPRATSRLEQLIAEGRAARATRDLLDLRRRPAKVRRGWASRELKRQRTDRRL